MEKLPIVKQGRCPAICRGRQGPEGAPDGPYEGAPRISWLASRLLALKRQILVAPLLDARAARQAPGWVVGQVQVVDLQPVAARAVLVGGVGTGQAQTQDDGGAALEAALHRLDHIHVRAEGSVEEAQVGDRQEQFMVVLEEREPRAAALVGEQVRALL